MWVEGNSSQQKIHKKPSKIQNIFLEEPQDAKTLNRKSSLVEGRFSVQKFRIWNFFQERVFKISGIFSGNICSTKSFLLSSYTHLI